MEPLFEYQDYVLAYRLRLLVGGKARPLTDFLSLTGYAKARLERQTLAETVFRSADYREPLGRIEALTERLNFGFWHNPSESSVFLRRVIEAGGCPALASPEAFVDALLTRRERGAVGEEAARDVATYYLGLLRASAAYLSAETFTRLRAELEPLRERLPVFVLPPEVEPV